MSMSTVGTKGQSLGSGSLGTLNEWKTMYNTENVNYDSAALFAEVFSSRVLCSVGVYLCFTSNIKI